MANVWPRAQLGDVTVNFDSRRVPVRESDRRPGPYPYYGASGIVDHVEGYLFDGLHLLIAEDGENLRSRQLPLAFLADGRFWVNNHAHIVTGNERADTRFLSYALAATDISGYITGSAIPKLSQRAMNAMEIPLPPLEEQRAIVGVLGSLDDKIEQNRRTSQALERLARAIFRAWFVDFEPVKAKAAGAKSFPSMPQEVFDVLPSRFVDSEIGPIPNTWETRALYDTAQYINGAAFRGAHFCQPPDGLPVVKIAELKYGITAQTQFSNRADLDPKYNIDTGEMLYSWSGSPDTSLDTFLWSKGPGLLNQHIFKVVTNDNAQKHFVYYLLKHLRQTLIEIARDKQTTGLGHVTVADMRRIQVCWPSPAVLNWFERQAGPLFEMSFVTTMESEKLAELRDYLLPKLLSGTVRVNPVCETPGPADGTESTKRAVQPRVREGGGGGRGQGKKGHSPAKPT